MKTITLTEEAYQRLKDWKNDSGNSFSKVVIAIVPKRGTLSQMTQDFRALPPLTEEQAQTMEAAVDWGRDPASSENPWNS